MNKIKLIFIFICLTVSTVLFSQTTEKKVILQGFWWDYHNTMHNDSWANYLAELAPRLKSLGIDAVWIPPSYKNAGTNYVGYSPFDHYDLGDKYQKGNTRTRLGTKDELLRMIAILHANGIEVIQDIVLNHVDNAGTANGGLGGQDPEPTYSMATSSGYKNFRYACHETPVPMSGENATEYLARKGRWTKNYTNFHPHAGWNNTNGNWEADYWGPDIAYGIDESGTGNGFGQSTNATYNPTQSWNYNRNEARNWIMWFTRQTGVDGFRWDAVKHFPHFVVQDLSYNLKYLNGFANLGENMINFGEYVGSKSEVDGWVNAVRYSNGGTEQLAGAFDFSLRGAFKGITSSLGSYDLSQVPAAQQNERVHYYAGSNTHVHRTVSFVNSHDTFRPIVSSTGNYTGWDASHEIGGHIEPNDPRLSVVYALTFALDGTPMIFFEDLFNIGYNNNRYSHDPKDSSTLTVNSDLENIIWCHQNLDFADGAYLVRGHNGNTADHLVIERSGKAVIGVNDNWNTWQSDWVDTNFPPGTILVDYSGANGSITRVVQNDQRVEISTPPCDGSATNGRRGYSIWAPQNAIGGYTPQRQTSTTQEWEMANDLGDSHCYSLQQGGEIPTNSTAFRNVGRIFVANNSIVNYNLYPSDTTADLTIELFDVNGNSLIAQNGTNTISGTYSTTYEGWINIKVRNTNLNQTGQKCWVKMAYLAPESVDLSQFSTLPTVAKWTGSYNSEWSDCRNWEFGLVPNGDIDAIIPANSSTMPSLNSWTHYAKSLTIENGASLTFNNGNLHLKGDLINHGSIGCSANNYGNLAFSNSQVPQNITGNSMTICRLQILNPHGVYLGANVFVTNFLEFLQNGKLYLENHNITISTATTILASSGYIIPKNDPNSGGSVIRTVGNASLLFPIGDDDGYKPVYIKSNGAVQPYKVRVFDDVYNNGNTGGVVNSLDYRLNHTWEIQPLSSSSIDADIIFNWTQFDEGNNFNSTNSEIVFNNGANWQTLISGSVSNSGNLKSQTVNSVVQGGFFNAETPIPVGSSCLINWIDLQQCVLLNNGKRLRKNVKFPTGWTGAALSQNSLAANEDGWVEMKVLRTNKQLAFGLAPHNNMASKGSIRFGIEIRGNGLAYVVEKGKVKQTIGTYAIDDIFTIAKTNGQVQYFQNGNWVYTSTKNAGGVYYADVSFKTLNGEVFKALSSFSCSTGNAKVTQTPIVYEQTTAKTSTFFGNVAAYPNPFEDNIMIDYVNVVNEITSIELYHINGQHIRSIEILEDGQTVVDTKDLASGLYIIVINGVKHLKVMKM